MINAVQLYTCSGFHYFLAKISTKSHDRQQNKTHCLKIVKLGGARSENFFEKISAFAS